MTVKVHILAAILFMQQYKTNTKLSYPYLNKKANNCSLTLRYIRGEIRARERREGSTDIKREINLTSCH